MRRALTILLLLTLCCLTTLAQQYDGMTGLIHTPTAEMDTVGTARIGAHYLSSEMLPHCDYFTIENWTKEETEEKHYFNSFSYYLSITPFRWVELSYICVGLAKGPDLKDYTSKDRHFSVKFNPLREGKWWPSICLGTSDFMGSTLNPERSQNFFANYYISGTKHFNLGRGHQIAVHASYRYYVTEYNKRFQGLVGGITYSPGFAPNVRLIGEWDGCHINCGLDALFWRHLRVQASLQDGRYFSAGLCFQCYLLK